MFDALASSGLLPGLAAAGLAAIVTYLLTPTARWVAVRLDAVDHPERRSSHEVPTPRLGGAALSLGAMLAVAVSAPLFAPSWLAGLPTPQVVAFLGAIGIIFLTGAIDDIRGLHHSQKFLAQLAAAGLVLAAGGAIERLSLPFLGPVDLGVSGYLASMLWIVGITNAVNLIDGLDGLAGGIGLIISGSIAIIALFQGQAGTAVVAAALAGACLGFLPHNWTPASIFMGDSGSLTMGFVLAVLTHSSSLKSSTTVAILVPILALGLPAIDTLLVMLFRFATGPQDNWTRRIGRMFKADRQHVHHLLLDIVPKRGSVVLLLYGVVGLFCLAALAASLSNNVPLGLILLVVEGGVIILVRKAGLRAQARALATAQREKARVELQTTGDIVHQHALHDEAVSVGATTLPPAVGAARGLEG